MPKGSTVGGVLIAGGGIELTPESAAVLLEPPLPASC
jgi:hypothetical protein